MEDLNDKITGGNLTAAEWNQVPSELQNVIEQTGQVLTNADLNQVGKGIAQYAGNGAFYTDSGAANAYVLTAIGTKQAPTSYDNGMIIRFIPGNTNSTASTVNVATLGVKSIVNFNGDAMTGGELPASQIARAFYDLGNDRFQLLPEINANYYSLLKTGRRNGLINAGFDIFQRNSTTTVSGFFADRWEAEITGSTATYAVSSHTVGQTDVPQEPQLFLRNTFTAGAGVGDAVLLRQPIEDVRTYADEIITLSFWARSPTSLDFSTEFLQNFGGGGSASVSAIGVNKITLTSTFTRFTVNVAIPSISGATIGTSSALELILWYDAGSNFNARTDTLGHQSGQIDISNLQVERGSEATDFEKLETGEIVELCERYFEKSYDIAIVPGSVQAEGRIVEKANRPTTTTGPGYRYNTRKRTIPTVTLFSPVTGASGFVDNNGDKAATISLSGETGVDSINITGGTISDLRYHFTASAEL